MSPAVSRIAAALAVCSAVLHVISMVGMGHPLILVLTAAMALGCLYCAYELLRHASVRSWVLVAVMNLGMIGLHMPMSAGHHHGGPAPAMAATMGPPMGPAMQLATAVAVVEVLVASAVLFYSRRGV